eukprot:7431858-Pyramimonas_sp.AAC.1
MDPHTVTGTIRVAHVLPSVSARQGCTQHPRDPSPGLIEPIMAKTYDRMPVPHHQASRSKQLAGAPSIHMGVPNIHIGAPNIPA